MFDEKERDAAVVTLMRLDDLLDQLEDVVKALPRTGPQATAGALARQPAAEIREPRFAPLAAGELREAELLTPMLCRWMDEWEEVSAQLKIIREQTHRDVYHGGKSCAEAAGAGDLIRMLFGGRRNPGAPVGGAGGCSEPS